MSKNKDGREVRLVRDRLEEIKHEVLVAVASGVPLPDVMKLLCLRVEAAAPRVVASVLRVDDEGRLRSLAAPSLPDSYTQAVDGVPIGPSMGSCGTAAYLGVPVEVADIRTDPLWAGFKDHALAIGLKACWSSPIKAHSGRVVGTFAFYARTARKATEFEKKVVQGCVHLCAIAIESWQANARIHQLAYSDGLTGLGNRALVAERFGSILESAGASGKEVAVLYVDLNGFRSVNDLQGHKTGDKLLCYVAGKLRSAAPAADLIARLGGDEFLIIQTERERRDEFDELARRVSETLAGYALLEPGVEVRTAASIGGACYPRHGTNADVLMAHADTALCRVKRNGKPGYAFYTDEMDAERRARRELERDVSAAVAAGQLSVVYQPQADAHTGAIRGFEALLRWNHPVLGAVSPAQFIPAAEACGAIEDIGAFALREALSQAAKWPRGLRVAVNVSPAQIVRADFAQLVEKALSEAGVEPSRLEIEVTESLFIYDATTALDTLRRLKRLGVSVAIDDFGTGYSSLSTLRAFPFDRIKIDRSFVFDLVGNADAAAIVNSIMGLGRAMRRPIVAEGVETKAQLELLRLLGCNEVQGYLIGKPLPIETYSHITHAADRENDQGIKRRLLV
jgi:diguanylate cyclase (GGDEF)-like protein